MEKKRSRKRMTIQNVLKSKSKCEIPSEMQMCMVNRIPSEILMEILSRLPTDSILQCRQVCRPWENITHHPSFADMHPHQLLHLNGKSYSCHSSVIGAMVDVGLLFCFRFPRELGFQLYYGEYGSQPNRKLRRINQPSMNYHSIVGSCNGLICFSEMNLSTSVKFEPVCICNPITREYVNLARLLEVKGENKLDSMVCDFGYHHSIEKYKIVKINYIEGKPLGQVQVYTLGDGSGWSDVGETNYSLQFSKDTWRGASYRRSPLGAFANGARVIGLTRI
ncbi:F-box protein At3g07870-like [Papaver somniferum]|uniref:F-box protein At3g07870-like n=1 Tax=Papaver somniferum TaxID=3469 RepID=UPI000E6F76DC|nr:F-box protein At3g07870-like [Papaver somniferum]